MDASTKNLSALYKNTPAKIAAVIKKNKMDALILTPPTR